MANFIPGGFLSLKAAVDATGRHLFGSQWTGKEIKQLRSPPPKHTSQRLEKSVEALANLIISGALTPMALADNGQWFEVPSRIWTSRNGRTVFDHGLLASNLRGALKARRHRSTNRRILIAKLRLDAALGSSGAAQRRGIASAEHKTKAWLIGLMADGSPDKTKSEYLEMAKSEFGIGTKAFYRAWGSAKAESQNPAWGKPGPKSRPRNQYPN